MVVGVGQNWKSTLIIIMIIIDQIKFNHVTKDIFRQKILSLYMFSCVCNVLFVRFSESVPLRYEKVAGLYITIISLVSLWTSINFHHNTRYFHHIFVSFRDWHERGFCILRLNYFYTYVKERKVCFFLTWGLEDF